jgi:tRNA(Ile2) C34 agmatinyltransferase TiaS
MDLLACPSCGQRFAVRGAGALGGWLCTNCGEELNVIARRAFPRKSLPCSPAQSEYHLRPLGAGENDRANRIESRLSV